MNTAKTTFPNQGPRQQPFFPDVTVILGDPRLPDTTKVGHCYSAEDLEAVDRVKKALGELPAYRFTYLNDHETLLPELLTNPPSFVLNLCDTGFRNVQVHELHLPALLEILTIPYTGAGPLCMARCLDKALVRAVAAAHGIPVPSETYLSADDKSDVVPSAFPAILKPTEAEGSLGITKEAVVRNVDEATTQLARLRAQLPGQDIVIQEFLPGAEYGIGLIGNPGLGFVALPALEVDYSGLDPELPRILSYESKTVPDSPFWTQIKYHEARMSEEVRGRLIDYSRFLFQRLDCRDYARFDFRTGADGEIRLLEVNSNPAWCWDGKLNFMAEFAGYSYSHLLELILEAAQKRVAVRS